jgi:hypothetical protein
MFKGLRSEFTPPPLSVGNPGKGAQFRAGFSDGDRSWEETVNLVDCLSSVLSSKGHAYRTGTGFVELDAGFILQPRFVELQPGHTKGVRTTTTVEVHHPQLVPDGAFEYQHSRGSDTTASVIAGLQGWAELDLVVFLDAARDELEHCTGLQMGLPDANEGDRRVRRVVLGPPARLVTDRNTPEDPEHPFCPCCLLTKTMEAFRQFLAGDAFYGIRVYAARTADASVMADCRINGEDWEPGTEALRAYAETWPGVGVETREQYVIIHSWDAPSKWLDRCRPALSGP